jgi:hypothetical protein
MLENNKGVGNGQNLNQSFDERQQGLDVDDMNQGMGQQGMGQGMNQGMGQDMDQDMDQDVGQQGTGQDIGQQGIGQDQDMEIQDLGQQDLSQQQGLDDDDMDVSGVGDIGEQGVQPGVDSTLDDDIMHENLESGSTGMNRSIE